MPRRYFRAKNAWSVHFYITDTLIRKRGMSPDAISTSQVLRSLRRSIPGLKAHTVENVITRLRREGVLEKLSTDAHSAALKKAHKIRKSLVQSREALQRKSPKERSRIGKKRDQERATIGTAISQIFAGLPKKRKSEIARRRAAKVGFKRWSEIAKDRWAGKSSEERSKIIRKAWETRRKKIERRLARVAIIDDLPNLKLLTREEETMFVKQYFDYFFFNRAENKEIELNTFPISWFSRRLDYDDVKQEFRIAILTALRKWDRKRDLDRLVTDSIVQHMYRYFVGTRKYDALMSYLEAETAKKVIKKRKEERTPRKER